MTAHKLISLGTAIAKSTPSFDNNSKNTLPDNLYQLLIHSNGLLAFESALMIRPLVNEGGIHSVFDWNDQKLWKSRYGDEQTQNTLFFAEDAFGYQFGYYQNQIYSFDPETGEFDFICKDFIEWCDLIVSEYKQYTGYAIMHEWQIAKGPIALGNRLCPKLPFVLGGQYEIDNLYSTPALDGILLRASVATQIRDVPDGSSIKIEIE